MPFLGQDWRSPGDQWVRTAEGWERTQLWRLKLFENLNENVLARLFKVTDLEELLEQKAMKASLSKPHIIVTKRLSREKNMQMSLGEALTRLDMCGAAKDLRRFNYVCKLLEFLVKYKLTSLSGAAQKVVFNILEEVINRVIKTNTHMSVVHSLLRELQLGLDRGYYAHVGSDSLWSRHQDTVHRLQNVLNEVKVKERPDDGKLTLSDLPDDCLREILYRLDNHRDLVSTGLSETRVMALVRQAEFWRHLCVYHFSSDQWRSIVRKGERLEELSWPTLYHRLAKRYGLRDAYAEMLHLCEHCETVFWENHGHHCLISNKDERSVPLSPAMCVELFMA